MRPAPSTLALAGSLQLAHLATAASSAGCAADQGKVKTEDTTSVDLDDRNYLLYLPKNYEPTEPAPLILSYHGGGRDAQRQQALDRFNSTHFNKDYIVAYPNSVSGYWQGAPGVDSDDVGFTKQILDQLEAQYCVDTDRIYATGKSQGGGMVGLLAADVDLSMRFAAFAPVSGAFYVMGATTGAATPGGSGTDDKKKKLRRRSRREAYSSFLNRYILRRGAKDDDDDKKKDKDTTTQRKEEAAEDDTTCDPFSIGVSVMNNAAIRQDIPILEIHGKADAVIPYSGGAKAGGCLPAIEHWAQSWALANGLDAATNTSTTVSSSKKNSDAVLFQFGSGEAKGRVSHIMSGEDVGHDWPSTEPNEDNELAGHAPASFNASSVIMDFFETYRLGGAGDVVVDSSASPQASVVSPSAASSTTPTGDEGIASGASPQRLEATGRSLIAGLVVTMMVATLGSIGFGA